LSITATLVLQLTAIAQSALKTQLRDYRWVWIQSGFLLQPGVCNSSRL